MSTLQKIRRKVRRLTASPSSLQLPDSEIDDYVDIAYEQDLPADLKLWNLNENYTVYTTPNEDRYTIPVNTVLGINPPVYVAGEQISYTQKNEILFAWYPKTEYDQSLGAGDTSAGPYTFTLENTPIARRSLVVYATDTNDVTQKLVDIPLTESTGNIVAETTTTPIVGTINYLTGVVTFTFSDTIATTETIRASYYPYVAGKPKALLFYDQYLTVRPIPDKVYRVDFEVYTKPTNLLDNDNDSPDVEQWWQMIAFSAALKILEDRQDTEMMQAIYPRYDEQRQYVLHRTILQNTNDRTQTIYSNLEQGSQANGNSFGRF